MNTSISKKVILLPVLFLLLFSGCVYYNTFYNAKKAFKEAESVREQNKYTSGRGNAQKYNLAIEKCLKVIENYPNTKYYDDALYVLAVSYFHTDKFNKADRRFRELLANYPESEYIIKSRVYLAKTKLELLENEEAMQLFEEIFLSDVDKEVKAEAAMGLGRFHYENKNYEDAQPYFMSIRDSLGTDFETTVAQRYIADGYYDIFQFGDALSAYLQLLGMDIETKERYHTLYNASQCAFALMKISEGMDYLNTLMEDELYYDSLGVMKLAVAEGLPGVGNGDAGAYQLRTAADGRDDVLGETRECRREPDARAHRQTGDEPRTVGPDGADHHLPGSEGMAPTGPGVDDASGQRHVGLQPGRRVEGDGDLEP